ncbi:MAG: hypothetical protein NTV08_15680, partial [Verrucomicrobia bacterium]|nr:hypothetical protein [Verrucomicrobiota bacterium]
SDFGARRCPSLRSGQRRAPKSDILTASHNLSGFAPTFMSGFAPTPTDLFFASEQSNHSAAAPRPQIFRAVCLTP